MPLVILLGLSASLLFASAAFLQQQGIRSTLDTSTDVHIVRGMPELVRNSIWLTGWLINLIGFFCQAIALHYGSVALVQPLLTTQLLFTLFLVSWHRHVAPRPLAWFGCGAITGGLVLLMTVDGATPLSGAADRPKVLLAAFAAACLIGLLLMASSTRPRQEAAILSATAAGLCFAMSAVFMKLTADDLLSTGVGGTATDWPGYLLAASTLAGLLIEQAAFAVGPLTWSVAAMNITNPIASYLVGVLAFQVSVPTSPGALASIAGAGLLIVLGVTALAHVPVMLAPSRAEHATAEARDIPGAVG